MTDILLLTQAAGLLYRWNVLKIQDWLVIPDWLARLTNLTLGRLLSSSPPADGPMGATLEIQRQEQMERLEHQMLLQRSRDGPPRQAMNNFLFFIQPTQPVFDYSFFFRSVTLRVVVVITEHGARVCRASCRSRNAVGWARCQRTPTATASQRFSQSFQSERYIKRKRFFFLLFSIFKSTHAFLPFFLGRFFLSLEARPNNRVPPSEENVTFLTSMGFSRDRVMRALQTTGNNVEAAANLLVNDV